jgi:hypothetical protein
MAASPPSDIAQHAQSQTIKEAVKWPKTGSKSDRLREGGPTRATQTVK